MEFNTTKTNRGKAAVSSAKNFVADKFKKFDSKISSDYAPEKESASARKKTKEISEPKIRGIVINSTRVALYIGCLTMP